MIETKHFERAQDFAIAKMNAVLREERLVNRLRPPTLRDDVRAHVRDHQRQDEAVARGHLDDDEDARHRRAHGGAEHRAHPDERECADVVVMK